MEDMKLPKRESMLWQSSVEPTASIVFFLSNLGAMWRLNTCEIDENGYKNCCFLRLEIMFIKLWPEGAKNHLFFFICYNFPFRSDIKHWEPFVFAICVGKRKMLFPFFVHVELKSTINSAPCDVWCRTFVT